MILSKVATDLDATTYKFKGKLTRRALGRNILTQLFEQTDNSIPSVAVEVSEEKRCVYVTVPNVTMMPSRLPSNTLGVVENVFKTGARLYPHIKRRCRNLRNNPRVNWDEVALNDSSDLPDNVRNMLYPQLPQVYPSV